MTKVEILPLIAEAKIKGVPQPVKWHDVERLVVDNIEVAKLKPTPGAAISIYPHIRINAAERAAISAAVAEARGGVPPSAIHATCELYEILKAEAGDDTEVDDE